MDDGSNEHPSLWPALFSLKQVVINSIPPITVQFLAVSYIKTVFVPFVLWSVGGGTWVLFNLIFSIEKTAFRVTMFVHLSVSKKATVCLSCKTKPLERCFTSLSGHSGRGKAS